MPSQLSKIKYHLLRVYATLLRNCERARPLFRAAVVWEYFEGKKALPPGAPNFLLGATLRFVGLSVLEGISFSHLKRARGPKRYLPRAPTVGAQIGHRATRIANSHGLPRPLLSPTLNWDFYRAKLVKLKKSEILGMASWALWSHGLESL